MNNEYDELERGRSRRSRRRPGTSSTPEPKRTSRPVPEDDFLDDDYQDFTGLEEETEPEEAKPPKEENYIVRSRETERAASAGSHSRSQSGRQVQRNQPTSTKSVSATAVRAAKREKQSKVKKFVLLAVAECLALIFIFSYAYAARAWNMLQRPGFEEKNVTNTDLDIDTVEKMKGYWTIAVFGVDSRTNNVGQGTNADVNMICNINQDTGEIKLVSVFRDSYLNISDGNSYNKINAAYAQGGPEQAVKAMNKNMDLNITDYVTFNWKAVADAINILGGVDVEISKAEFYYINSFITETVKVTGIPSVHLKKAGMNHLDGVQAVAYGRLRLMDTDFARTERQRKIIELAFEKAKKADVAVLNNLMVTIFPQVATSVDAKDLSNVVFSASKYHIGETTGFPTARGDANMGKKGACVIPQTLESNVIELHKFLFGEEAYTPSNTVKTISKKIAADTGMYKEGTKIDKVPTDGGYVPKPSTAAVKETTEAETKETKETQETKESTSGSITPGSSLPDETDENGEPITPPSTAKPTKPGSTEETTKPDTTKPDSTKPTTATKPTETSASGNTPGSTKPTKPSATKPESTTAAPTEAGPGTTPPTTAPATTESPTIPPAPIESGNNGNSSGPGSGNSNTGVVVGPAGP